MLQTETEVRRAVTAIAATVGETPDGAPEGVIYAAMMGLCDLHQFQCMVDILLDAGLVTRRSHVLYPTPKLTAAMAVRS